jgi:hypothetical protein
MRSIAVKRLAVGFAVLFIAVWVAAGPIRTHFALRDRLHRARSIACACKLYAGEHAGKYPDRLAELIPDYMPDARLLQFLSVDGTRPLDLECFGGSETDPSDGILLRVAAEQPGGLRVIVRVDMSGAIVKD